MKQLLPLKPLNNVQRLPNPKVILRARAGEWVLLAGSYGLQPYITHGIIDQALQNPLWVVDGGRMLNTGAIQQHLQGNQDARDRLVTKWALSCHHLLMQLEQMPSFPVSFVVLDLLYHFYDEKLPFARRKQLLQGCLKQLDRLKKTAGGIVHICPPVPPSREALELLHMVEDAAAEIYRIEILQPDLD